jgi:hypothetical protein
MSDTPATRIVQITYTLERAWETWEVEVPAEVTDDEIIGNNYVGEFITLVEQGNDYMTATEVESR